MRLEPATVPHSNPLVVLRGDVAFGTFGLLPPPAHSQEWPARPLTMVVPTAAGGGADIVGRILAARLPELLGQPVIIENVGNAVAANNRVAKGGPGRLPIRPPLHGASRLSSNAP
jgi:tripartite-type tricarboxylate transporter receptor subunit TctC